RRPPAPGPAPPAARPAQNARCFRIRRWPRGPSPPLPPSYARFPGAAGPDSARSEEHTSELQSRENLVCRLLLEKKEPWLPGLVADENPQAELAQDMVAVPPTELLAGELMEFNLPQYAAMSRTRLCPYVQQLALC